MTALGNWMLVAPLWLIGLVSIGGMFVAYFGGAALRRRLEARVEPGAELDNENGDQGMMVSAVMGLLALLFAFTFSIAINRFDSRRSNVVEEANAIGTTYLRVQLIDQPHRDRLSRLLLDYSETRIALAQAVPGKRGERLLKRSDRLIGELWSATVAAFPTMRAYPFSNSVLDAMNGLIDMDTTRKAGRQAHVPSAVFLTLLLYQFMTAGVISYAVVGRQGRRTASVLFVLLGVLLVLIIDVDRPTGGGVVEAQEPMLQLLDFIKSHPPTSFGKLPRPAAVFAPDYERAAEPAPTPSGITPSR